MEGKPGHADFDGIVYVDTLQEFNTLQYTGRVIHILCSKGNMGFTFQDTCYHIAAGDYVILPNATLVSDFLEGKDFQGILMSLSDSFITSIAIRSNYGIIGHLSLLQNPVMKLSSHHFHVCRNVMQYIRNRDLDFYASRLCITPHYLSEICKKVSGKPATYWIDRFTIQEITHLLRRKDLSLTAIAERMNFSSVSYFSRYVQKRIKVAPSEYRKNFQFNK